MTDYCCFLPKDKNTPLKEAKEIWDRHKGHFIGIGYIFPQDQENSLQTICTKSGIHLYKLPMQGLSFEAYRDSYKIDYLKTTKQEKEGSLRALMSKTGIENLSDIKKPNSAIEKSIRNLAEEIDELEAVIKRSEKASSAREAAVLEPKEKANNLLPSPYTVKNLLEDLCKIKEGLKTGYSSLDASIEIPQGAITLIAGRPSHGKTITKLNLLLKMVRLYPEMSFYFFSYEETKSQILLKLLNIMSADLIHEHQNLANLEGYLRGGHKSREKINKALEELQVLTEKGRLVITDHPYFVDELSEIVSKLRAIHGDKMGAVFVDYIQKVKIKHRHPTRQMELQKISEAILEMAKANNLPIVLGAQLGRGMNKKDVLRLDNLREAGDIENDAKLVIGIWNQAKEDADSREESLKTRKVDIELTVLKNRNGPSNQSILLEFDRSLSTINEKPKPEYISGKDQHR